ncbi:DEAD-box ATP-dependent RNA helicase 26 [Symbiodinium microadriaticum]|uniref:ATP-dependent RNA helicase n=1 Tax=Symbiodinium microadriaticum TaxID=2951 RepID=A0A1Q9DMD0_SYMMI|nr:DEAD-box ATP-dependent RNA helicase 26 [Symbiodinium microadriaticum]
MRSARRLLPQVCWKQCFASRGSRFLEILPRADAQWHGLQSRYARTRAGRQTGGPRAPMPEPRPEDSPSKFADLELSEETQTALREGFGYQELTQVQAQVLPMALAKNFDLVVRAHTGTGKTLAFLIPAIEKLAAEPAGQGVAILVVSPTRELALQIGREAEKLLSLHDMSLMTMIGGTSTRHDQVSLRRVKPRVLVSTPGRLLEHLERTYLFPTLVQNLQTLVLDEADRLLSLGFLPEVREIVSYLPTQRRTMLFSATMPESVMDVVSKACRGNYRYIDCVGEESQSTASTAEQSYVVLNGHQCLAALYNLIMNEMAADRYGYKILVFFATARLTTFMAQFFREQLRIGVYEIHRRRDADARIATQERFKEAQSGILFSSDVSARGMDYPNVTLVLQFGAPATREMYIHRVGRTARAGKSGQAVLILGELESSFLTAVQDLPIRQHERAEELKRVNELLIKATTSWLASAPLRAAASAAFASLLVHYKATHRILHMEDDAVIQESPLRQQEQAKQEEEEDVAEQWQQE